MTVDINPLSARDGIRFGWEPVTDAQVVGYEVQEKIGNTWFVVHVTMNRASRGHVATIYDSGRPWRNAIAAANFGDNREFRLKTLNECNEHGTASDVTFVRITPVLGALPTA